VYACEYIVRIWSVNVACSRWIYYVYKCTFSMYAYIHVCQRVFEVPSLVEEVLDLSPLSIITFACVCVHSIEPIYEPIEYP